MRVIRVVDYAEMSDVCAHLVMRLAQEKADLVLGLPTGGTPLGMYTRLVSAVRAGTVDLSRVTVFNLDEYVGLPPAHAQSYHAYMARHLYDQPGVRFDRDRLHVPPGTAADLVAACDAYEASIAAAGGLDIAILGVGTNGHIAFNEPGCSLASRTRVVRLSDRTVLDNARFFADPGTVPRHAMTMGVGTIRDARALLLMASGAGKAQAVSAALEGPVTSRCPASAVQLHPRAVIVLDEEAASALTVRHPTRAELEADPHAMKFLFG
jgi:glucosamine-6-phosphate deaminase